MLRAPYVLWFLPEGHWKFKKNVQNLSNLYFSNISWNIWTFALQIDIKVPNMKHYKDWMRNFESYCSILARVWIKVQFKQPQINDCSTEEILRLTRGCYFGRLKWKFVIEKEFFSTFALHYLYQGSIRTAKYNFLILHHLQFLMNAEIEWKEYKSNFMILQFFSFRKLLIAFDQKNRIF